jgi:putative MATE family efflux protein
MGVVFVGMLLRAGAGAPRRPDPALLRSLLRMGGDLVVRVGALLAAFTLASAVLAHRNAASLGAHQIASQLFLFLALVLDAIAIAGQVLVGRLLGAGDEAAALGAARRMIAWSVAVGVLFAAVLMATIDVIPHAFTTDDAVLDRAHDLWPLFALMQIPGAAVFALDGILIGAGDTRYIAGAMVAAFAVFAPVVLLSGGGVVGVWIAMNVLMLARLVLMAVRFAGRRWVVLGST